MANRRPLVTNPAGYAHSPHPTPTHSRRHRAQQRGVLGLEHREIDVLHLVDDLS